MKKTLKVIGLLLPLSVSSVAIMAGCSCSKKPGGHEHSFVTKYDKTSHWQECECGEKKDSANHTFTLTNTVEATCENAKTLTYKCNDCDYSYTETVGEKLAHRLKVTITKEATCQEDGVKTFECLDCHNSFTQDFSNPDAHKWDQGTLNDGITTYHCLNDGCEVINQVISLKEQTEATIDIDLLNKAGTVELKEATIALDSDVLDGILNDVTIGAEKLTSDKVTELVKEEDKALLQDAPVFDFSIKDGEEEIHNLTGMVKISVPYTLADGEDPDSISIAYINEEGNIEHIPAVFWDNQVTFETNHFSYYAVVKVSKEKSCELFGHNLLKTVTKESTCAEHGYEEFVCTRCGKTFVEELPLGDHNYVFSSSVQSTKTEHGHVDYECSQCHNIKTVELPLLPEGEYGYLMQLIRSLTMGNLHLYTENPMDNEQSIEIFASFADKANPYLEMIEGEGKNKAHNIITKDGTFVERVDGSLSKSESEELLKVAEIISKIENPVPSISKLVDFVESFLFRNLFAKTESQAEAVITINFDRISEILKVAEEGTLVELFDELFGEGKFDDFYGFIEEIYEGTIENAFKKVSEKYGIDVKEAYDFVCEVASGEIPPYEEMFTADILKLKVGDFIAGSLGLDESMASFETIDGFVNEYKDASIENLLSGLVPGEFEFPDINEYKDLVSFELKTTLAGQFISCDASLDLSPFISIISDGTITEMENGVMSIKVDTVNNIDSVKADLKGIQDKIEAIESAKSLEQDSQVASYFSQKFGIAFTTGETSEYKFLTSGTIADMSSILGEEYAGVSGYINIYPHDSDSSYYEKTESTHGLFKDDNQVYALDYTSSFTEVIFVEDESGFVSSVSSSGVWMYYDLATGELKASNHDVTNHFYKNEKVTEAEYRKATGNTYPSDSDCYFYKKTCMECGYVTYDYFWEEQSTYSGCITSKTYPESYLELGSSGSVWIYGSDHSYEYIYSNLSQEYVEKEVPGIKVTAELVESSKHDCCFTAIYNIYVDGKLFVKFARAGHNDYIYDTTRVLYDTNEQGCYTEYWYKEYCSECGKFVGYDYQTIGGHDFEKIGHIDETFFMRGYDIVQCKDCGHVDVETTSEWSIHDFHYDELKESYYCEHCGEVVNDLNELIIKNISNTQGAAHYELDDEPLYGKYVFECGSYYGNYIGSEYSYSLVLCNVDENGQPIIEGDEALVYTFVLNAGYIYRSIEVEYFYYGQQFYGIYGDIDEISNFLDEHSSEGLSLFIMATSNYGGENAIFFEVNLD